MGLGIEELVQCFDSLLLKITVTKRNHNSTIKTMDILYLKHNKKNMTDHKMVLTNIQDNVDSKKVQRQCSQVYYLPSYWKNAKN